MLATFTYRRVWKGHYSVHSIRTVEMVYNQRDMKPTFGKLETPEDFANIFPGLNTPTKTDFQRKLEELDKQMKKVGKK